MATIKDLKAMIAQPASKEWFAKWGKGGKGRSKALENKKEKSHQSAFRKHKADYADRSN